MVNNTGFLVGPDGVASVDTCSTELRTRTYLGRSPPSPRCRCAPW